MTDEAADVLRVPPPTVSDEGLRGNHSVLGEIRGIGLLAGVELRPPTGDDGRAFARDVLNGLVDHGVLAGLTGPRGDALKIRPR